MTLSTLHDPELGSIVLRPDTRARRLTFRMRDGRLHVSLPPGTPVAEVRKAVDQLRPRLKTMRGAGSLPLIDTDYRIDTDFFHLSLTEGTGSRFLARGEADGLQIYKNGVLLGDVDVPKNSHVIGYIPPFYYAAIDTDDESETITMYKFKLEPL